MKERFRLILRTSIIGIIANLFLAGFKVIVGTVSNSIAIVLDGVNNLSDAASSLITIVGTALAGKPADKKHPFGYGRIEYLTSMVIAALVLYAGITSLVESVKGIITPEPQDYSAVALIVIVAAVALKVLLALYTGKMGRKTNSDSLIASSKEAMIDAAVSSATVLTAGIYLIFNVNLSAWLAALISLIIIKAGAEMLKETISKILGEPGDAQLAVDIKKTILSFPGVNGAYDLILNNYGPETHTASVHIDVDDTRSITELDSLSRKIIDTVKLRHNVFISAVGFYSHNSGNPDAVKAEAEIRQTVLSIQYVKGFHGFYIDFDEKQMSFDLVISFDAKDRADVHQKAVSAVQAAYPGFTIHAGMDMDIQEALDNV